MRNFSIVKLSVALLFSFISKAQTEITIAKKYLSQNASNEKLSTADIARMEVSSAYLSPTTGWYHIYFKQMYESIEVYNGILNTTIKDGNVAYVSNSFVPNLENSIQQNSLITTQLSLGKTQISPAQALQIAATNVNLKTSLISEITTQKSANLVTGFVSKATLLDKNLSDEEITVQIYWFPYMDGTGEKTIQKIALTYNVQFLTKDGKNKWSTHVDAFSGKVLASYDAVIHCDFGKPDHDCASHAEKPFKIFPTPQTNATATLSGNTYNVFDYPLEAPTFGSRTLVSSPYNRFAPTGAGPDVATNGWHNDGTTAYTNTRGNNVWAKDDIAGDNETTIGPSSATLDFDFPYSQTTGSAATNLNAAITNLFYWNNVMHDVLWRYGFDEPSGNFQKDNQGRGGAGNDFVFADAQDGSGTNNANFSTPVDGTNGRMQMFIWSNAGSPTYTPDSDFDNAVIAHEYGHGWSTRLTGGSANSNCLNNAEQGGEGWSDYIALMTTTNWANLSPNLASANIPRGIGTYVKGQATTGAGIRPYLYSYDKTTYNNPVTYAGVNSANESTFPQPHGIGSIWATMLWDMTWEIILQDNQIVNNIYDVPANITDYKGNIAALKLVNEGLRLQPCSPSFVQARDAILQADNMLFGGRYRCSIGKAFARRGLGYNASTGTSSNDRIVTEDFTPFSNGLSSPLNVNVCSGSVFNYTATTAASGTFTYNWTRAVVSGISNAAGSGTGANISETLINTTANDITVQYQITISPNACGATPPQPQIVNVVVKNNIPTPLSSTLSDITCSGTVFNYTATTAAAGTYTYSWTRAVVPGISNTAGSGSDANISETLINTTQNPIAVQYQFVVNPNICGTTPLTQAVSVVINPSTITPTVTTYAVCQNATVPVGGGLAVAGFTPVTTVNGTIASGPTYVRGSGNNVTTYTASRAVFYKTYTFVAPASGALTLATTDAVLTPGTVNDTYLTLYQTSFNPASPATNFLKGNDDISGINFLSSLTQTVTAGTTYIVVVSTFTTGATGTFTLQASTAVFGQTVNWYLNASGGSPLATGAVFNPVGVTGSGIPNTATAGSNTFYVADALYPDCRTAATFTVQPPPSLPSLTASGPTTFCNGGSVTLNSNIGNNNALNFVKTSSQYVTVPHSASINLGATFTMEAWVQYSGRNVTILDKGDYDFLWMLNPDPLGSGLNTLKMGFWTKNTGTWNYSTGIVLENTWTHVAVTLNAGTLTFFVNGVPAGTAAITFSQDNQPMNIGRQQPTACVCNHFNGSMDELRLWNVVRTPAQMLTNMNTTIPSNSAGLVAYYKFDEGTGSTTADATGNGNDGTLVNSPTWQVPATSPVNRVVWLPGGATTPTIVATNVDTYTATVTNGYGCTSTGSITINSVSPIPTPQTNTSIATGGSLSLTATGCSGGSETYTLKWYKASDNSLVTMPVSPATTTNYYAKCENTFNSTTCLSPASTNVTVYVGNIVNSIITGDWENTNTWTPSRIPLPTDNVIINNHTVTITSNAANAKRVDLKSGGNLKYLNSAAKLKVGF